MGMLMRRHRVEHLRAKEATETAQQDLLEAKRNEAPVQTVPEPVESSEAKSKKKSKE